MNRTKVTTILVVVIIALIAVLSAVHINDPHNIKLAPVASDTPDKDLEKIKKSDLPKEDIQALARFMLRQTFDKSITASTVGEAIESQKRFEKVKREKEKELELKEVEEQEERDKEQETLRSQFPVRVLSKSTYYNKDTWDDYNTLHLSIGNVSKKTIRAIHISIVFSDLFGDPILEYNIKSSKEIGENEKLTTTYYFEHNKFRDIHKRFRAASLENMKYNVYIEEVLFSDGTSIKAKQ